MQILAMSAHVTDLLRQRTHEVHERLHRHPITVPLLQPTLTIKQYRRVLLAFYPFYRTIETQLATFDPSYKAHCSFPLLEKDLGQLKLEKSARTWLEAPQLVNNMNGYLGARYVIEGSKLGGQMIAKKVRKYLGLDASNGLAFFTGTAKETAVQWAAFRDMLSSKCDDKAQCAQVAEHVFLILENWLDSADSLAHSDGLGRPNEMY